MVAISWTSVANSTSYNIYQTTTSGAYDSPIATVGESVYQYQATNLENGTPYYFVVKAVNDGGDSEASIEVSAIPQVPAPGAPVLHAPVSDDKQVTLSWDPVIGASEYKIYSSITPTNYATENGTVAGSVYTYNVTGLTNGTPYYFTVKATNPGGESVPSNEVSSTPMGAPSAPSDIKAKAGNRQAIIYFTAPSDDGGSPITGYEVISTPGNITVTGTESPIKITGLDNGTSYAFKVKAITALGKSVGSASSNSVVPRTPSTSTPNEDNNGGAVILVNGKVENAGIVTTYEVNGQMVTSIAVDEDILQQRLDQEGIGAVITIPIFTGSDVAIAEFNGRMIKNMENLQAVVEIRTEKGIYTLPAVQINIDALSNRFGTNLLLQDVKVRIEIAEPLPDTLKVVEEAANREGFTPVAPSVNFKVSAVYDGRSEEISRFNAYVKRMVAIPEGIDLNLITTGIVVEQDGTVRHVPTKVIEADNLYYAQISSLTNSTYSVVWHPLAFEDVANHWAKDAVNNMGSRMVINGFNNGEFKPDQVITRAEFAEIIVRGLGLKLESGAALFTDVSKNAWYYKAIQTAHDYGLINGFEDGSFRPDDRITRQQAMVVIARAMEITELQGVSSDVAVENLLGAFKDQDSVSSWARSAVADSVEAGIVLGRRNGELAPDAYITRAEVALIIQRLLQKSSLI